MTPTHEILDGGGFYFGSKDAYPGDAFVSSSMRLVSQIQTQVYNILKAAQGKPVVYVALNYRVGIYGCTSYYFHELTTQTKNLHQSRLAKSQPTQER